MNLLQCQYYLNLQEHFTWQWVYTAQGTSLKISGKCPLGFEDKILELHYSLVRSLFWYFDLWYSFPIPSNPPTNNIWRVILVPLAGFHLLFTILLKPGEWISNNIDFKKVEVVVGLIKLAKTTLEYVNFYSCPVAKSRLRIVIAWEMAERSIQNELFISQTALRKLSLSYH